MECRFEYTYIQYTWNTYIQYKHLETYMKGSLHTPLYVATPLASDELRMDQHKRRRIKFILS